MLKDSLGAPVQGVPVKVSATGSENTITGSGSSTMSDGQMTAHLWSSKPEQKIATATLPEGKSLVNRAVVTFAPPLATSAVVDSVTPGSMVFTDENGLMTTVDIPTGAVIQTTVFDLVPESQPGGPVSGLLFAGHAFAVEAYYGQDDLVDAPHLNAPFTITVNYQDANWQQAGVLSEENLNLYYWDGTDWEVVLPCQAGSLDTVNNGITVQLDHLTHFALFGSNKPNRACWGTTFLPAIRR